MAAFEGAARSPARWLATAEQLRLVADTIGALFASDLQNSTARAEGPITEYLHAESGPVFLMLAGLALECVTKGILIKDTPSLVQAGALPAWLTRHDLRRLLDKAGVRLESRAKQFVHRAEIAVVWEGRYPVAKDWENRDRMVFVASYDPKTFHKIYEPLRERLQQP